MSKPEFQIKEHIGVLSDGRTATELNLVEWGNRKPIYDLRSWKLDELRALRDILNGMEVLK